jgi:hypothetical protein
MLGMQPAYVVRAFRDAGFVQPARRIRGMPDGLDLARRKNHVAFHEHPCARDDYAAISTAGLAIQDRAHTSERAHIPSRTVLTQASVLTYQGQE